MRRTVTEYGVTIGINTTAVARHNVLKRLNRLLDAPHRYQQI